MHTGELGRAGCPVDATSRTRHPGLSCERRWPGDDVGRGGPRGPVDVSPTAVVTPPGGNVREVVGYIGTPADPASTTAESASLRRSGAARVVVEDDLPARTSFLELLARTLPGDMVVVASIDRLARSVTELVVLLGLLHNARVGLEVLDDRIGRAGAGPAQQHSTTPGAVGGAVVELGPAELGRLVRSASLGRRPSLGPTEIRTGLSFREDAGCSWAEVARRLGVSRATVIRHLRPLVAAARSQT